MHADHFSRQEGTAGFFHVDERSDPALSSSTWFKADALYSSMCSSLVAYTHFDPPIAFMRQAWLLR